LPAAPTRLTCDVGVIDSVLIAVPTLGTRPLLPLLRELAVQADEVRRLGLVVMVVLLDNSHAGSEPAREAAAATGAAYLPVSTRGFTQVRNAALDAARHHDVLVFIDDDELPCSGWLEHLVASARTHQADVVVGPVDVRVPPSAPRWLDGGTVLRPQRSQPDGPLEGHANSGNTLLRMSTVQQSGLRFDPAFNGVGGEDTDFFTRLARRDARLYWASAARVVETPDPERMALSYVMRRAYRVGVSVALIERAPGAATGTGSMAYPMLRRVGRVTCGLLRLGKAVLLRRPPEAARGLMDISFACGWFMAMVGLARGRRVSGCRS
jgi:glycosyltransferase involved in cell wall biosynthesis